MQTYTITDAKKQLGALLKEAASGQEIGIVCGADIIALRKVQVRAIDAEVPTPRKLPGYEPADEEDSSWEFSARVRDDSGPLIPGDDWFFRFEGFDSEPGVGDAARNHDDYLYGDRR